MSVQVPKGYKQTEVGVIPSDWSLNRLVDLAEIRSGIAKNANANITNPVSVYYLRVANVQDGFLDLSEVSQLLVSRDDIKRYAVMPNDMLMNEGGDLDKLGRGALWSGEFSPCIHQNHVFVVRCGKFLLPIYLKEWTGSTAARRYFLLAGRQTTNLASINKTSLGQLPIPLPPTQAEQQAIAEALSDADALIESLEQLIDKKRQIKQGAMQELLTGQRRLPGFSGEWTRITMRELLSMTATYGIVKAGNFVDNGIKMLRGGDISDGYINLDVPMVTKEKSDEYSRTKLIKNDVVISLVGYPGESGKIPDSLIGANISRAVGLLRLNKRVAPDYLVCFLNSDFGRKMVLAPSAGSAQQVVNLSELNKLSFDLPEIEEQTAISEMITSMKDEIQELEKRLLKLRMVKQSMMQELLTGRIRLI